MARSTLWFIVSQDGELATFSVDGVTVAPYVFTYEQQALLACDHEIWPEDVRDLLVVRPGPATKFLDALSMGFPGTQPRAPDALSLNGKPGELLSGLIPLTSAGARLLDEINCTTFEEKAAAQGFLWATALTEIKLALGQTQPH